MSCALITGTAGMVGSHLLERLVASGQAVIATYCRPTVRLEELVQHFDLVELDVRYAELVRRMIERHKPAVIYHLAAQSLPTLSWENPWETLDVNVQGTINVFEAIRTIRATRDSGYDPMVVVACSSAEYGASLTPQNVPVDEDAQLLPLHPYGVSKVAQDLLSFQYWRNDRIRCIRARIFNCTGPRKRNEVISDFSGRIARLPRAGGALRVGNLHTRRAILDVRDLVSALTLLADLGVPGEAYNICGDDAYRIGELIPLFEEIIGRPLLTEQDPALFRPSDEAVIFGRNARLKEATGWRQTIGIRQTLAAVLNHEMAELARAERRPAAGLRSAAGAD